MYSCAGFVSVSITSAETRSSKAKIIEVPSVSRIESRFATGYEYVFLYQIRLFESLKEVCTARLLSSENSSFGLYANTFDKQSTALESGSMHII